MVRTTPELVLLAALVAVAAAPALAACGDFEHCSTEDWTACTEVESVAIFINRSVVESEPFSCLSNVETIKGSLGDFKSYNTDYGFFGLSLKGLEKVTHVGDLTLGTRAPSLYFLYLDVSSLGAIKTLAGLSLHGNSAMFNESFTELPFAAQLEEIGDGGIDVSSSPLRDLSFPALTSVSGTVRLADNAELESFSLGNAAVSLRGNNDHNDVGVDIQNNDKLKRVALGNVATVARLSVVLNPKLEYLSFGSGPTAATSDVFLVRNGELEDLSALSGFSRIEGTLTLMENWKLASACLCNLRFVDHLVFEANPELDCQELRAYLDPLSRHPSNSSACNERKRAVEAQAGSASCDCDADGDGGGNGGAGGDGGRDGGGGGDGGGSDSSSSFGAGFAVGAGVTVVVAALALVVWRRRARKQSPGPTPAELERISSATETASQA